jgi:hypothetical protein
MFQDDESLSGVTDRARQAAIDNKNNVTAATAAVVAAAIKFTSELAYEESVLRAFSSSFFFGT